MSTYIENAALRHAVTAANVHAESVSELNLVLSPHIGADADGAFVKDAYGRPVMVQGRRQTVAEFVSDYVRTHEHHRATMPFHRTAADIDPDAARERIERGDRSPQAINNLFEATRHRRGEK